MVAGAPVRGLRTPHRVLPGVLLAAVVVAAMLQPLSARPAAAAGAGPTVSIGDQTVLEGNSSVRAMKFPITLSEPATTLVQVGVTVSAGSATGATRPSTGVDFKSVSRTVTFKPALATGRTPIAKVVSVVVYGDTAAEPDETLTVTLANPSAGYALGRASGSGTILDDDASGPGVTLGIGDGTIVRANSGRQSLRLPVTLSDKPTSAVSVSYTVEEASATYGKSAITGGDFGGRTAGTVAFVAGGAAAKYLSIPIWARTDRSDDAAFSVTLSSVTDPGVTLVRDTGTATIVSASAGSNEWTVPPASAATLLGAGDLDGVRLVVPADAFPTGATITLVPDDRPQVSVPVGLGGRAFTIESSAQPVTPVQLEVPFPTDTGASPGDAQLAWWSEDTQRWQTLPTHYDSETGSLTTLIGHFSTWNWVLGVVAGQTFEKPVCQGSPPEWSSVRATLAGEYGIAGSCAGTDPATGDLHARFISDHPGFSYVVFRQLPDRLATTGGVSLPPIETSEHGGGWYVLLAPGETVEAYFTQPSGPGAHVEAIAGRDGVTYALDVALHALDFLPGVAGKIQAAIQAASSCYDDLTTAIDDPSKTEHAVSCLTDFIGAAAEISPDGEHANSLTANLRTAFNIGSVYAAARDATVAALTYAVDEQPIALDAYLYADLPDAMLGEYPGDHVLPLPDGNAYGWEVTEGVLPTGLTLDYLDGQIEGLPTATGASNFTVTVTDSGGNVIDTRHYRLSVRPRYVISGTVTVDSSHVWHQQGGDWNDVQTELWNVTYRVNNAPGYYTIAPQGELFHFTGDSQSVTTDYNWSFEEVLTGSYGDCTATASAQDTGVPYHTPAFGGGFTGSAGALGPGEFGTRLWISGSWAPTYLSVSGSCIIHSGEWGANFGGFPDCEPPSVPVSGRIVGTCTWTPIPPNAGVTASQTATWDLQISGAP